jgi:hypothetical protein
MNKLTKCGKYLIKCILYTRRRWALSFAQHVRWAEAVSANFRVKMNELNATSIESELPLDAYSLLTRITAAAMFYTGAVSRLVY